MAIGPNAAERYTLSVSKINESRVESFSLTSIFKSFASVFLLKNMTDNKVFLIDNVGIDIFRLKLLFPKSPRNIDMNTDAIAFTINKASSDDSFSQKRRYNQRYFL